MDQSYGDASDRLEVTLFASSEPEVSGGAKAESSASSGNERAQASASSRTSAGVGVTAS